MRRTGPRRARLLAAAATLALALSPALVSTSAEARPGGGSSSGSRGSRTYSAPPSTNTAPGTTSNFNRTETPRGGPQSPAGQAAPGYAGAPARSGFGGFGAGLMGGLLGAGLVGMLFGSGAFGGMAGTPARATNAELALQGQALGEASIAAARAALEKDFKPLDDFRASAWYRMRAAQNLLKRLHLELTEPGVETRLVGDRALAHA